MLERILFGGRVYCISYECSLFYKVISDSTFISKKVNSKKYSILAVEGRAECTLQSDLHLWKGKATYNTGHNFILL